jgi:type I restriction enzyme M protein
VETGHVEVMLNVGNRFFQNHDLSSTLWFINKGRPVEAQNTTLLIDARAYSSKGERTRREWSSWQVKNLTAIVWLYRGELEKYRTLYGADCILLKGEPLVLSSSEIRENVREGSPLGDYVPPAVEAILQRDGLYRGVES